MQVICNIIKSKDDFDNCVLFLENNKGNVLGFDLETNGLEFRKEHIVVGFGISTEKEGYYLPVAEYDPDTKLLNVLESSKYINDFLKSLEGHKLTAWNGAFEASFCHYKHSWDFISNFYADCMLMLHTANENLHNYGLKECSEQEFGAVAVEAQQAMLKSMKENGGTGKEYYKASAQSLGEYCIWDCALTVMWYNLLQPKLETEQLEDYFYNEKMELYKYVTIPMEWTGVRVDVKFLEQARNELKKDIKIIHEKIQKQIQQHLNLFTNWFLDKDYPAKLSGQFVQEICEYFNLSLPKTPSGSYSMALKCIEDLPDGRGKQILLEKEQLTKEEIKTIQMSLWKKENKEYMFNLDSIYHQKKLFFDTLHEKPISKTPTGAPQCDEDFLLSIRHKYDWVKDWIVYRKLMKISSSYIERFAENLEGDRFYPSFMQHKTISGRYGSDFQQMPRLKDEDGVIISEDALVAKHNNVVRNLFIADEGKVLIDADYESLEPHIFAHVSNDPAIKEIFLKGLDFYSTICIKSEQLKDYSADKKAPNYLGKLWPEKRQSSKEYGLGFAYGETAYKVQFTLNIPKSEAEKIEKGYWNEFKELAKVKETSHQECLEKGFVRTEAGLVRRYPDAPAIYKKYGDVILDDLELWKAYNKEPGLYYQAKIARKKLKKYLNNSINIKIQGLAASVINKAAIAINKQYKTEKLDAVIIAQIHDELLVSASIEHHKRAAEIMQDKMENTYKLSIPLKAVPNIGQRYGEIK